MSPTIVSANANGKTSGRRNFLALSRKFHSHLSLLAGIGLLLWCLSGLLHVVMSWTGPQPVAMFPPTLNSYDYSSLSESKSEELEEGAFSLLRIGQVLMQSPLTSAQTVKVVASEQGPIIQRISKKGFSAEYTTLDGLHLPDYDQTQALWLARYYSGLSDTPVDSIERIESFSSEYPWVNRLLPVHKISFAESGGLTVFVDTRSASLASINNDYKRNLQALFSLFHTWSWLENLNEYVRVTLLAVLLLVILMSAISGIYMLFTVKPNRKARAKHRVRFFHNRIAIFVAIPLLMFSISGLYHLLTYSNVQIERPISYGDALSSNVIASLASEAPTFTNSEQAQKLLQGIDRINTVALVNYENNLYLRVNYIQASSDNESKNPDEIREKRFIGMGAAKKTLYIDAASWQRAELTDKEMALNIAEQIEGLAAEDFLSVTQLNRFSGEYDFRNKRLPVWRVEYGASSDVVLFVDPQAGVIVDRIKGSDRAERWSFRMLHKWNFLRFMGRDARDAVLFVAVASLAVLAFLGLILWYRRGRVSKAASSDARPVLQ